MRAELIRRPAVSLVLGLIVGIAVTREPLAIIFLVGHFWVSRNLNSRLLATTAFALGSLLAPTVSESIVEREYFNGTITVRSVPRLFSEHSVCEVESERGRFAFYGDASTPPVLGEKWRVRGVLRPLREASEIFWLDRGVVAILRPFSDGHELVSGGNWVAVCGNRWRKSFINWSRRSLRPDAAALVDALCFNLDSFLSVELRESLVRSGTLHIVSASGLHVMIVAGAILLLGGFLPLPRIALVALSIFLLLLYASATGFRPPVIRAVIMMAMILPCYLLRREPDGISALALAAAITLVIRPSSLFELGFQLSYVIVAALVMFVRSVEGQRAGLKSSLKSAVVEPVRVSLIATLASAPLLAFIFGRVAILSVASNVLIAVCLPVVVVGALLAHLGSHIAPGAAQGFATYVLEPLTGWVLFVAVEAGELKFATLEVPTFAATWVFLSYALMLLVWRVRVRVT